MWLERSSRPKAMNFLYKNSLTHSILKTDMTGKTVLNIMENIFVRKFPTKVNFVHEKKIQ